MASTTREPVRGSRPKGLRVPTAALLIAILLAATAHAAWARPHCERREARAQANLERGLAKCDQNLACQERMRKSCRVQLRACDASVCEALPQGEPPPQGGFCPADTPAAFSVVNDVLYQLTPELNAAWPSVAAQLGVDPLEPALAPTDIDLGCEYGGDEYCGIHGGACHRFWIDNFSVPTLTGLGSLQFQDLRVAFINGREVSFHSNPGPDASKITDGISAAEGTSYDDPSYAVVLPNITGEPSVGLTVDLGQVVTVCGNGYDCKSRPVIQASGANPSGGANDEFQLDYSTDGVSWTRYGVFPAVSGGGLQTRAADPDAGNVAGNTFDARYVRVYPISGDGKYTVSELTLWDISSNVISVGKRATGPHPAVITDGISAPAGTAYDDTRYAVVLPECGNPGCVGEAFALTVDLGQVVTVCGNGYDCKSRPVIQADHNDVYQLDYSTDGSSWTRYGVFPEVSDGGLQVRAADPDEGNVAGNRFDARYVRVYPTKGDGKYSVSELTLWDRSSKVISVGKPVTGPEPRITNGELAPAGTSASDSRYAVIQKDGSVYMPLYIDLGREFPLHSFTVQADDNLWEIEAFLPDFGGWQDVWSDPNLQTSSSELLTRENPALIPYKHHRARYFRVSGIPLRREQLSLSEVEIEVGDRDPDPVECPYDDSANDGENFACTYSGAFDGGAFLLSGAELGVHVDSAVVKATCDVFGIPGSEYDVVVQAIPATSCSVGTASGTAEVSFCAGQCASLSPPSVMSYAQLDLLEFGASDLVCDGLDVPPWLLDLIEPKLLDSITPPIENALNQLLAGFMPFPASCSP
jgi:hypothetical protein